MINGFESKSLDWMSIYHLIKDLEIKSFDESVEIPVMTVFDSNSLVLSLIVNQVIERFESKSSY